MLNEVKQFIPNIMLLPKKQQYEILVFGYDPDDDKLLRYKKKACCAGCRRRPFPMELHQ